jgi:hypothetical protein
MVLYIIFYGFETKSNVAQNTKVLAFLFTEEHQFAAKTNWNSVFLGREANIPDPLHIIVLYINFYGS